MRGQVAGKLRVRRGGDDAGGCSRGWIVKDTKPEHRHQDAADHLVQIGDGNSTRLNGTFQRTAEAPRIIRHLHVQSISDGVSHVKICAPIAFDKAIVSPSVLDERAQQRRFGAPRAVNGIVGGSHGAGARAHGGQKRRVVNFLQRALIDMSVFIAAIIFLIVANEMFRAGNDALALNAANVLRAHRRRKERVFAVSLEVSSALRHANHVNHRSEGDMNAFATVFVAEESAILPGQA